MNSQTILIVAGGTGGHIFPALAVAEILQAQGVRIVWCGTERGLENTLVTKRFPLEIIQVQALRGKGLMRWLLLPWQLMRSVLQSVCLIHKIKPQLILAMGGYAAGPVGIAAFLKRIPLVVHEQNTIPGLTNRLLSKWAKQTLQAFPNSFHSAKVKTVGNPVRTDIIAIVPPEKRLPLAEEPLRILILGGSQGAHFINETMLMAWPSMASEKIVFKHQTGVQDFQMVQRFYQEHAVAAEVNMFIEDMAAAYAWADLVIARAGALTISELAAVGIASILIPFPFAVDDHQLHNARVLAEVGAAIIMCQQDFDLTKFTAMLKKFATQRALLLEMAQKARQLASPTAAQQVADVCLHLIQGK